MNYGRAIEICKSLNSEEHSESEFIEAVGTILNMATINAVPKEALLNVVRYFWTHCVEQVENGEAEVAPMTNADWIQSMSDDELGEFMMYDHPCDEKAGVRCTGRCDECIRNWLQEKHKEDQWAW